MALHACIHGKEVVAIVDIDNEQQYQELAAHYSIILFIEDLMIQPQIGWTLEGSVLTPPENEQIAMDLIIKATIKKYQNEASELLRDLYTANTLLGITIQQSDEMFDEYQDVLLRIREGAWPTALYRLSQKQPSGFVTQEMIDNWYNLIVSKMNS